MSCDIKYNKYIFCIQKESRFGAIEYYVFIGNVENDIYNILKKLEDRKTILANEVKLLKKLYPNDFNSWINIVKQKIKIKFINNKIQIDDSLNDIRKKIFVYLSNPEEKYYILPENQELWLRRDKTIKNKNSIQNKSIIENEIIGYYYEDNITFLKSYIKPHIDEEFNLKNINDEIFFSLNNKKKNTSENKILIYDLVENSNFVKNIIYLSDAKDEEKYLKSKNINITTDIINKYFIKYWPYVNLSYNLDEIKNNYLLLKDYYNRENYIFNLINSLPVNHNIFGKCNILTARLSVNDDNINDDETSEYYSDQYIDLFPIFDYIREKKIDEKTPFLKYSEDILESPFSIISKKSIDSGKINIKLLKDWLGLNEEPRRLNGIIVKRYLNEYNNKPKYYQITLNKTGKININVSFDSDLNANFSDIEDTIKNCKKFIEDINKNRIIKKKDEKIKINPPNMEYKDNIVKFNDNTKIIFMNIIIPLKLNTSLDFKSLFEFSKKFPFFLTDIPKNTLKTNNVKKENSIRLKYKRVSGFANMNDILLDIDILKQKYQKDTGFIIKELEKKYQKGVDEIKGYLLEWEKKYASSKSKKISSEFKTGILITISDKNIQINGVTKIYHIPIIYNFFVLFMNLFINYDKFIKDSNFKKIFQIKNIDNIEYLNKDYEINKNAKINIPDLYNGEYDYEDTFLNNTYSDIITVYNQIIEDETYEKSKDKLSIVGLASDEDIGPNIRLTCNDAIVEVDTCEDFCNDNSYFLRRLQRYDIKLFNPFKNKKDKENKKKSKDLTQYSRKCGRLRQPVVLPFDPEKNPQIKRNSYSYSIKYSSDPVKFQRWYICPKIWCPYCELPISEADVDKSTIKKRATKEQGGVCLTAICPYGNHQVFVRDSSEEAPADYPGFLDASSHPDGLCVPCCFKKSQENPKSTFYKGFKKCLGDDIENENIKDGKIYILGKGAPIDKDRYGKLPLEVSKILKTNLEKGYLDFNSGYLKKGIKHQQNNSFLSSINDIIMCNKNNKKVDIDKIKKILIDKLDLNLFRSLHSGNLENIFQNPKDKYSPLQNYINYLLNDKIDINHKYLWDFLQRPNILFEDGINIFIFENNRLLCPIGENITDFYNKNRNNILLIKERDYYEPIYYLEGDGKGAKITCIFNTNNEEITKLHEIVENGCKSKNEINWIKVLTDNIKKYDISIDNLTTSNGYNLQYVLNELLINIKNKKLDNGFIPILQYVDSYNKVFALLLNNKLYLPIEPSKIIEKIKYKIIENDNDIDKISFNETIKYTKEINKKTQIKCNITHKILDLKEGKNIIALVNEYNRFIPIKNILNIDKILKISSFNYYSDINEAIKDKIQHVDKRIEIINKKNFEDESFIRMKFELSKFLQLKENNNYLKEILEIIESIDKNINNNRKKMYNILNKIYKKLLTTKNNSIDYNEYKIPNKRVPCFLRKINSKKSSILDKSSSIIDKNNSTINNNKSLYENNKDIEFSCEDDLHCVSENNHCKLFINEKNLLKMHKNIDNYDYYLAKIIDELLRYKIKRNEILNDNIPVIINKEFIEEKPNKYIIIHSSSYNEINNIVDKLYLDNKGLFIDARNLYEESYTKEYAFKKDTYIKSNNLKIDNDMFEYLSVYWERYLSNNFKVKINEDLNLFELMSFILNNNEIKYSSNDNEKISVEKIKNKIVEYLKKIVNDKKSIIHINKNNSSNSLHIKNSKDIQNKDNKNNKILKEETIIDLYKNKGSKIFKYITSFDLLLSEINSELYDGSEIDLEHICNIYNINIIVLDKRIKKDQKPFKIYNSKINKSNYYILLYKSIINENNIYNLIQLKNKFIFKLNELPSKFVQQIVFRSISLS
jgi:hypothetical protein